MATKKLWTFLFLAAAAGLIALTTDRQEGRRGLEPLLAFSLLLVFQTSLLLSFLPGRARIFDRPQRRARNPNGAARGLGFGAAFDPHLHEYALPSVVAQWATHQINSKELQFPSESTYHGVRSF